MAIQAQCPTCKLRQAVSNKVCVCGEKMDAAKRAGKVKFWISYWLPGRKQRFEPVGFSIEEARDAEGKRRAQKREGRIFDILPKTKKTFPQLAEWFTGMDKTKGSSYFVGIKAHLKRFNEAFGDRLVNALLPSDLESLQVRLRKEGYSPSYTDAVIKTARQMIATGHPPELRCRRHKAQSAFRQLPKDRG